MLFICKKQILNEVNHILHYSIVSKKTVLQKLKTLHANSPYSSKTIVRDLLLGLVSLVLVVGGIAEIAYSVYATHLTHTEMNKQADRMVDELALMLSVPLYNIDSSGVDHIGRIYSQIQDVVGIRVCNEEGVELFDTIGDQAGEFRRRRDVKHKNTTLGRVTLLLSDSFYHLHRRHIQWLILGLGLAVALVVVAGIHVIMHFILSRPLEEFSRGLNEIADGDYSTRLLPVPHKDLNGSVQAVNRMAGHVERVVGELSQTRDFLNNVLNSMPSIMIGIDKDLRITELNRAAIHSVGIQGQVYKGKALGDVFQDLNDKIVRIIRQAMAENRSVSTERACSLFGSHRYGAVTVYPLQGSSHSGAVIRVDDITERVNLHEMMIQTEKMISVGGLGAGMAHEINNPLGGILQATQNIERRLSRELPANKEAAARHGFGMDDLHAYMEERQILVMLAGIREAGQRAAKIVQNMLQFSRRNDSTMGSSPLAEILDQAIELAGNDYDLKRKYDFRNVRILRKYQPDVEVYGVRSELEQVFLNLFKNAAQSFGQATGQRTAPELIVHSYVDEDYVTVEVTDNGPGIDDESLKRIFEPFFTTKKVGEGTGLGLAVSFFIIADQHNGQLLVDSEPGKGTTFTVKIPVR